MNNKKFICKKASVSKTFCLPKNLGLEGFCIKILCAKISADEEKMHKASVWKSFFAKGSCV